MLQLFMLGLLKLGWLRLRLLCIYVPILRLGRHWVACAAYVWQGLGFRRLHILVYITHRIKHSETSV